MQKQTGVRNGDKTISSWISECGATSSASAGTRPSHHSDQRRQGLHLRPWRRHCCSSRPRKQKIQSKRIFLEPSGPMEFASPGFGLAWNPWLLYSFWFLPFGEGVFALSLPDPVLQKHITWMVSQLQRHLPWDESHLESHHLWFRWDCALGIDGWVETLETVRLNVFNMWERHALREPEDGKLWAKFCPSKFRHWCSNFKCDCIWKQGLDQDN